MNKIVVLIVIPVSYDEYGKPIFGKVEKRSEKAKTRKAKVSTKCLDKK